MRSILIADDKRTLCERLCTALRDEGFHCESAATAASALKKLKGKRFHLLVCDIRLPTRKNEGITLIRKVRELEREGKIEPVGVIIITGYADKKNAIQALKLGAFDYLEKNFSIKAFKDSVNRYFAEAVERDRLIQALEGWINRHPDPDQKLFFSGEEEYSARDVLNEIKRGTKLGLQFKDALMKITFDFISKAKE